MGLIKLTDSHGVYWWRKVNAKDTKYENIFAVKQNFYFCCL